MNKRQQITITEGLFAVLEPIKAQRRATLRKIAIELKQMDGEHWAVGEMLERGCIFLDAYEMGDVVGVE